jgi:GNAT superfamily N-acetyltransferase
MIELRPVETDDDVDAFLAVRRAIDPEHAIARPAYRKHITAPGRVDLVARRDGVAVAAAFVEPHQGNVDGSTGYVSVRVLAEERRRGVGTLLFRTLSERAHAAGWSELYSVGRHDDADTLDYLGKRGFAEVLCMQELSLEVSSADAGLVDTPDRVELRVLGPELEHAIYEVAREVYTDVPQENGIWISEDFERWRSDELPAHAVRECCFAALAGREVVGYATLHDAGRGVGLHAMTGVTRAWRGRGVARALKSAQIAAAQAAGLRELRTTTAFANAPMLHVNELLGYRRGVAWVHLRGPLLDGSSA